MQIQRIQTVYIFIATVLMAIFPFVPIGEIAGMADSDAVANERLYIMNEYVLLIPVVVTSLLLLIDIFLYKNLKLQLTSLRISILLTACCIVLVGIIALNRPEPAELSVWNILPIIAGICEILGLRGIKHDIKLLNSYNRLR